VTVAEQPGGRQGAEARRSFSPPLPPTLARATAYGVDAALNRVTHSLFLDQTENYKQFKDKALFRNVVRELVKRMIDENPEKSL
jgi:hypothetical protein